MSEPMATNMPAMNPAMERRCRVVGSHGRDGARQTAHRTITDNSGASATDDVAIVVNPGAQHFEAENYIAMGGVLVNTTTTDGGGGIAVNAIDNSDWMDYSITVPTAGNYVFRFRVGTFYGGTQFQVKDAAGNVLGTVDMYATGWDGFMNLYRTIPLVAGTQTIRIQNTGPYVWYFNWFEVINNTPDASPLPVNFVLFHANCDNGAVSLLWKTAGERNSKNFTVERSANGTDWLALGTLAAAGQSSVEQSYRFSDHTAGAGGLYRIVQEDIDGRKTFSTILKYNCSQQQDFKVYPNPVDDRATLDISLAQQAKLSLSVVDSKGAVVRRQEELLPAGTSQLTVGMGGLARGNYTLYAKWNGVVKSVKLVKR